MILAVNIIPGICQRYQCPVAPLSMLTYAHSINWIIHFVIDRILKKKHNENRLEGYTKFYLEVKKLRRAPFSIVSFGNAVLLVTVMVLHDTLKEDNENKRIEIEINILRGLIPVECGVIICFIINYIIKYQNNYISSFLFSKNLPIIVQKRVLRLLFTSDSNSACKPR